MTTTTNAADDHPSHERAGFITTQPNADDGLATTTAFMTGAELATLLRTSPETIRYWRHIGYGPPGVKTGRHVLYARADVDVWVAKLKLARR